MRKIAAAAVASAVVICASTGMAQHSTPHHDPDGVVLINQSDALEGYITSRDAPGFPVTISDPGSYRLTSNLIPRPEQKGIEIAADDVTIDLNGFSIVTYHGDGITTDNVSHSNIVIRNGTIRGSATPVNLPLRFVHLIQIQVYKADFSGVVLGDNASITYSSIHDNPAAGLRVGTNSLIARNVVSGNAAEGINAGAGSIIDGNIVEGNQDGIVCSFCTINGNSVYGNVHSGIHVSAASINNNTAFENKYYGIWCDGDCSIGNNVVIRNDTGMRVDCPSAIRQNFANNNAHGDITTVGTSQCTLSGNVPSP
jgi:parallel beta-helix repeat protein